MPRDNPRDQLCGRDARAPGFCFVLTFGEFSDGEDRVLTSVFIRVDLWFHRR